MASNRPNYLLRMLRGLQKVEGLDPSMLTVFIDGFWKEPASVTRLMGVKLEQHAGVSRVNARITQVKHTCTVSNSVSRGKNIYALPNCRIRLSHRHKLLFQNTAEAKYSQIYVSRKVLNPKIKQYTEL